MDILTVFIKELKNNVKNDYNFKNFNINKNMLIKWVLDNSSDYCLNINIIEISVYCGLTLYSDVDIIYQK